MAAYLWFKNERELLKKITLAEAYKEAIGKSDFPENLTQLDDKSTLYQAL